MLAEGKYISVILRQLRKAAGVSRQELIERCQESGTPLSPAVLSRFETGTREPRPGILGAILKAVGASPIDFEVHLQIFNRYPPDKPLEPLTETELAALPQLDRRMRLFVQEKPGSLRARILYHAIKGQVLMEAIGDESEKLTAYIEERFRTAEEAP